MTPKEVRELCASLRRRRDLALTPLELHYAQMRDGITTLALVADDLADRVEELETPYCLGVHTVMTVAEVRELHTARTSFIAADDLLPFVARIAKLEAVAEAANAMRSCPDCDLEGDGHGARLIHALAALEAP